MRATAFINEDCLVERVVSRVPDPVIGDTPVLALYSDYLDFGGIRGRPKACGSSPAARITASREMGDHVIVVEVPLGGAP